MKEKPTEHMQEFLVVFPEALEYDGVRYIPQDEGEPEPAMTARWALTYMIWLALMGYVENPDPREVTLRVMEATWLIIQHEILGCDDHG